MTTEQNIRGLYEQQRYEHLDEVIFDYLQDDRTSVEELLADLRTVLIENRAYFRKHVDRHNKALDGVDQLGLELG